MQKSRTTASKKKLVPALAIVPPTSAQETMVVDEKKKRGRKKNAEPVQIQLEPQQAQQAQQAQPQPAQPSTVKKRVNRKKPTVLVTEASGESGDHTTQNAIDNGIDNGNGTDMDNASEPSTPHSSMTQAHKKRGRKPKGGKVIQQLVHEAVSMNDTPNIILHLKCSVSDIPCLNSAFTEDVSIKPGDVISFNSLESKGADLNDSYKSNMSSAGNFIISSGSGSKPRATPDALIATNSYNHLNDADYDENDDDELNGGDNNMNDIWKKLNHLKLCFHKSDVFQNIGAGTRRSCCFWDTCEFDTPPIYIPKCIAPNGGYTVYGCFCSPECALAHLMNEGIDTSVKFERCQMLNSMYGRALNYDKSIKPAPNPQYILNKFYGNLSIQEYRKLFKSEQIIYVVNKPLTHILPEMYEDNNDFLLNNKVIPNNNYKLKKKTSAFG